MWIYTSTPPYVFKAQCLISYAQGQLYYLYLLVEFVFLLLSHVQPEVSLKFIPIYTGRPITRLFAARLLVVSFFALYHNTGAYSLNRKYALHVAKEIACIGPTSGC
jgi:hypothetical protein